MAYEYDAFMTTWTFSQRDNQSEASTKAAPVPQAKPVAEKQRSVTRVFIYLLLLALAMLKGTHLIYQDIVAWEQTGGTMEIEWIIALLYNLGGKWAVVVPALLVSLLPMYAAFGVVFRWRGFREGELRFGA